MEFDFDLIDEIGKFLITHKTLIASLIINIILILVVSKFLDVLHRKIHEKLKTHTSDAPLLRLLPLSIKILKFILLICSIVQSPIARHFSTKRLIGQTFQPLDFACAIAFTFAKS